MLRSDQVKKKKNFYLSKKAHTFAGKLIKSNSSLTELKEFAQLGYVIGINSKKHFEYSEACTENIAATDAVDEDGKLLFMYMNLFPEYSDETTNTWLNIEKASSFGLALIEEKYYDADENLILWEELYKDFG